MDWHSGFLPCRIRSKAGDDTAAQITHAFEVSFARKPDRAELQQMLTFMEQAQKGDPLASLCRILLNANEFVYID